MSTALSCTDMIARITDQLAQRLGPQKYAMWFERGALMVFDEQQMRLTLFVPTAFAKEWIKRHFLHTLHEVACEEAQQRVDVAIRSEPDRFKQADNAAGQAGRGDGEAQPFSRELRQSTTQPGVGRASVPRVGGMKLRHELEHFIVGRSNELAYNAAMQMARHGSQQGPLFIHGGCGLGKTHLLQGVCRYVLEHEPDTRVLYTTGEQFTNAYITAVRTNKLDTFRRRMRNLDLLAVDDVHFIASREKTQQEFLHSFDQIELSGHRVVLASDSHPKLIRQFSEALVSRCVRGMVVKIDRPDAETRKRLIMALAQRRGLTLHDAACDALARHSNGSVREIEGLLAKLQAMIMIEHDGGRGHGHGQHVHDIGFTLIDRLLQDEMASQPARLIRFETILHVVAEQLGLRPADIMGRSRHQHIVLARSAVIHLARQLTTMSYPEIAAAMNRDNHSTIITAAQRMERQMGQNITILSPAHGSEVRLRDLISELTLAIRKAANEVG